MRAVADPDVVMVDSADVDLHVLRVAIRRRQKVTEVGDVEPSERSLPTPEQLRAMYGDVPEALAETLRVAEQCNLNLSDACPLLPSFDLVTGETAQERLAAMCRASLQAGQRAGR